MNAIRLSRFLRAFLCTALIAAAPLPSRAENRSDMWWNPDESGWGLIIVDHGTNLVAIWCTYLENGDAVWFVIPGGEFSEDRRTFHGDIYLTDGTPYTQPYYPYSFDWNLVGTASIDFAPADLPEGWARYSYSVLGGPGIGGHGTVGSRAIKRQPFGSGPTAWGLDATYLWWNPPESGWGVAVLQHEDFIFGVLLTYNANGNPTFFVFPAVIDDEYPGRFIARIYETKGPWWAQARFDPAAVTVRDMGLASTQFLPRARDGATSMLFGATLLDGLFAKTLVRQPFGEASPSP